MIEVGDQVPSSRLYQNLSVLRWLALALGLLVVLHHKLLEAFVRQSASPNRELLVELTYGVLLSLTAWLVLTWLRRSVGQTEKTERALAQTHVELSQSNQSLEFLLQLHRRLSEAQDETALIDTIAKLFMEVSPSIAFSLIHFDAQQQMLPVAYRTKGNSLVTDDRLAHLSATELRQECQTCLEGCDEGWHPCRFVEFPLSKAAIKKTHCLELTRNNQMFGILTLYLLDAAFPNDREQLLLEKMANEVTLVLESRSLRSRESAMLSRLQKVRQLSNLHDELGGVLTETVGALEVTGGVLFLVDRTTSELQLQAQAGQPLGDAIALVKGLAAGASQADTPLIIGDLVRNGNVNIHSLLVAPLRIRANTLGSMVLWDVHPDAFTHHRSQLVATVASQAALLIESNWLYLHGEHGLILAERARLAREIHDGLAQTLGYLKLRTTQINNWLKDGQDQRSIIGLDEVQRLLGEAYLSTREAIDGLRLAFEGSDLQTWVQEIVSGFEALSGIPVTLAPAPDVSLPPEVHVQLQRIVQESFSNIRKHACATHVWLEWCQDDYWLILHLKDNGRGFDLPDVSPLAQHGLHIMRERAQLLNADFQIASEEKKGTEITVRLPLRETAAEVSNG